MAGRHQKYPEYQESLVDWLGKVPSGWEIMPCRAIVKNMVEKNEGAQDQNYLSLMANIGVIKYEDKGDVGNKKPDDLSKCKIIKKGNLVINSMNYSIGSYGMSEYDGVCSPVYIVLDPNENVVHRRFALRIFENSHFQKYLATFGNGILAHRAAIGWDDIKGAYIPVPPKEEQLFILNFLDHETAKIDTLIDKQQQLIKLLREKRQAVISHAVTKGLNPDAPMKNSGVEWLGGVPEHWGVTPLAVASDVVDPNPSHRNPVYTPEGFPFISTVEFVGIDDLELNTSRRVDESTVIEQEERCKFQLGSIAFSRKGTIGAARILPSDVRFALLDSVCVINCKKVLDHRFLYQQINSAIFDSQMGALTRGAALPQISVGSVRNTRICLPPLSEQDQIVNFLSKKVGCINEMVAKSVEQITLLRERRTALISAAVTGKIDVRNWQPTQTEIPMEASA